jgi:uncharacterized protein YlxW (UPF0749 family)
MSKFNLFRQRTVVKQQTTVCQGLTESKDCSLVAKLRQLQKELDEANQKMQQLQNEHFDMDESSRFFTCDALYFLTRDYYLNWKTVHQEKIIGEALKRITNFDKFIEELTTIYNNESSITQEQERVNDLNDRITNIKQQLGIK